MQIKIYSPRCVRMNCTFVPQILKSNQACKCTGVSLKRITRISFSPFIRRRFFSSPSQLAFPYHTSKQMHMFCTYTGTPSEATFRTYVCSLLILSRSTKLQYQSCLPRQHQSRVCQRKSALPLIPIFLWQ